MRENIFTFFAGHINLLIQHKITKEELFNRFVACVEMADENERIEREKHREAMEEWFKLSFTEMKGNKRPYSNIESAIEILEK